jgi:oxygen-independent coproporphyrinogen-3 oxidase
VFPRELEIQYVDALRMEIGAHEWKWTPETLYLGGGTPGNLEIETLRSLLQAVPGRPWREATIESAPGRLTVANARRWAECGINRVSLGVQSFVDSEIRRTGRKHTAAVVAEEIRLLPEAGISNFNIDLIAGLSGQNEASWRESLDWIERLQVPHVSVYMLEVDEDSRLGKELMFGGSRYGAAGAPGEDETAALYEIAVERLRSMGVMRYEISNFARPGFESAHNLKYWTLQPYVGLGADAHSFDGSERWQNPESPGDYVAAIRDHRRAPREPRFADERFFVGLRLASGIRPTEDERSRFAVPIHRFLSEGLLEDSGGALRLSDRGVLLSNEVFQEFLET